MGEQRKTEKAMSQSERATDRGGNCVVGDVPES